MSRFLCSRINLILLSASVALLIASAAEAQVVLKPKHQPNTQQIFNVENTTKQILTLNGMDLETESTQFIIA